MWLPDFSSYSVLSIDYYIYCTSYFIYFMRQLCTRVIARFYIIRESFNSLWFNFSDEDNSRVCGN